MKRCNNCGYNNTAQAIRCEKCNYPVTGSLNLNDISPAQPVNNDELSGTIPGQKVNLPAWDTPNTGPLTPENKVIIKQATIEQHHDLPRNLNTPDPSESNDNPFTQTLDPTRQGQGLRLTRVPRQGESEVELFFSGNEIKLHRNNTDPGNNTITSKVQATLLNENGQWYIIDESALNTTYIKVQEKTRLKRGDIILLGNRQFRVDF